MKLTKKSFLINWILFLLIYLLLIIFRIIFNGEQKALYGYIILVIFFHLIPFLFVFFKEQDFNKKSYKMAISMNYTILIIGLFISLPIILPVGMPFMADLVILSFFFGFPIMGLLTLISLIYMIVGYKKTMKS